MAQTYPMDVLNGERSETAMLPRHPVVFKLTRSYMPGKLLDSSTPVAPLVKVQMLIDNVEACYAVSASRAHSTHPRRHLYA